MAMATVYQMTIYHFKQGNDMSEKFITKKIIVEESEEIFCENNENYTLVEDEGWEDEGKYSYGSKIFKDTEGLFWILNCSKTGSHFTDYDFQYETELTQVKQVTVTKKEWQCIKK